MADKLIKVGFLVSYDYEYLKISLPLIYDHADTITLAIDKDRKTWSGEKFEIDSSFFDWLDEIDRDKKIRIYEDIFHIKELSAIECDTRERNMLAQFMGEGGWHIQIDSDEYFLDFAGFLTYLKTLDISKPIQVYIKWITLYKRDDSGYLYTDSGEFFPVATNNPQYNLCRGSAIGEIKYTNFKVLHHSWARSEDEIEFKLKNWGHKTDFNVEAYFKFWKSINRFTYKYVRSFHPLDSWIWQTLEYVDSLDLNLVIEKVKQQIKEKEEHRKSEEKVKIKDWIPLAFYKLKAKIYR